MLSVKVLAFWCSSTCTVASGLCGHAMWSESRLSSLPLDFAPSDQVLTHPTLCLHTQHFTWLQFGFEVSVGSVNIDLESFSTYQIMPFSGWVWAYSDDLPIGDKLEGNFLFCPRQTYGLQHLNLITPPFQVFHSHILLFSQRF